MNKKTSYRKNFLTALANAFDLEPATLEKANPRKSGFVGFEQSTNAVESSDSLDEYGRPEKVVSVVVRAVNFPKRRSILTFWPHGEVKKSVAESNAKYVRNILTAFVSTYADVATFGDVADVVAELAAALDRPGLQASDDVLVSACNSIIAGFARRETSTVAAEKKPSNAETENATGEQAPAKTPTRPTRRKLEEGKEA